MCALLSNIGSSGSTNQKKSTAHFLIKSSHKHSYHKDMEASSYRKLFYETRFSLCTFNYLKFQNWLEQNERIKVRHLNPFICIKWFFFMIALSTIIQLGKIGVQYGEYIYKSYFHFMICWQSRQPYYHLKEEPLLTFRTTLVPHKWRSKKQN